MASQLRLQCSIRTSLGGGGLSGSLGLRRKRKNMRWSWKIGQLVGVDLRIHATFCFCLAGSGELLDGGQQHVGRCWAGLVSWCSVCLRDTSRNGACGTARKLGIRTRDITLLPIGGVARLERIPEDPKPSFGLHWLVQPSMCWSLRCSMAGWPSRTAGRHPVS